jgi:hypothetical protein
MTIWRKNCASKFEANKAVNDVEETFLANTSDLESQQKLKKPRIMKKLS